MKIKTLNPLLLCVSLIGITAFDAEAANIATWQDSGNVSYFDSAITGAGHTPVSISALNSAGLSGSGVNLLFLLNTDNSGYSAEMTSGAPDLASFVSGGGSLVFFDRAAGNDNSTLVSILLGTFAFDIVRSPATNLDLSLPGHPSLAGLTDASFDDGLYAAHGHIDSGNLPAGATSFIHVEGNPNQIVDFSYSFGAGTVRYSTIPADFYAQGFGPVSFQNAVDTYAGNLAVPEPSAVLLGGLGFLALLRRRR